MPESFWEVVIDPLELGDACKRRRIYIALVHKILGCKMWLRCNLDAQDSAEGRHQVA